MKKTLDTVIFDFDGVLFNTEEINYLANEGTFQLYGLSFSREEYAKLWIEYGLDMEDIVSKYGLKTTPKRLRDIKNEIFVQIIQETPLQFMIGIRESIEELLSCGYKIAIASSNLRRNIEKVLEKAQIDFSFQSIIGREDIGSPKPHPEVFLKCLESIDSLPMQSVVVEDAPKGIISAKRSGIQRVVAIPNIWTQKGDFSEASLILNSAVTLSEEIISEVNLKNNIEIN